MRRTGFRDGYRVEGLALQTGGKTIIGVNAYHESEEDSDFGVLRYTRGGRLDRSFSGNGKAVVGFGRYAFDVPRSLAIRPNGKIVAGGTTIGGTEDNETRRFVVARYKNDGLPADG